MRNLVALIVLATAACAGCGAARPTSAASTRLYVLDGGVLASDPARYRLTETEVQSVPLSVAAYLVVHPAGVLLWDAGAIADDERRSRPAGVEYRVKRTDGQERIVTLAPTLEEQLQASGFPPDAVTHLALSHYHWDHTADANAFAHATWLVREGDRAAMFADPAPGAARPATYAALKGSKTVVVSADEHDVFGDGTVITKAAPGHSEGHQVLSVKLAKTGGVVLSGDLYHYPEERTLNRLPTFEVSEEQTAASRRALEAFLMRTGAALWIQHDLVNHRTLRKAPQYYD
ncbi:MAG: N-acyl homoserine lactonase family protein [Acidobacteria bacterium]|nr:N-acyl homoserine lactonase family protein [Acidobacteriota bacterium]